jgi:hypothetical protein
MYMPENESAKPVTARFTNKAKITAPTTRNSDDDECDILVFICIFMFAMTFSETRHRSQLDGLSMPIIKSVCVKSTMPDYYFIQTSCSMGCLPHA